jgi:hypothetical protein
VSVNNGWTQEQVEGVYNVIAPLVEPKEMQTSVRFKRYLAADVS